MHFKVSSAICFNLDQSRILSSGNGLKEVYVKACDKQHQEKCRLNAWKNADGVKHVLLIIDSRSFLNSDVVHSSFSFYHSIDY